MREIILNTIYKSSMYYKKYKALVDDEDFEAFKSYKWCVHNSRDNVLYARARVGGERAFLHNLIMRQKNIDHINGNGLDCRRSNLRKVSLQQNAMNKSRAKNSTSKYKGVYWDKQHKKWRAMIGIDYKHINLGRFENEEEAALAYNLKAKELFGKHARLNLIMTAGLTEAEYILEQQT